MRGDGNAAARRQMPVPHVCVNDIRQQSRGLYGPMIVLDSAETWGSERNLIFPLSTDPQDDPILNGGETHDLGVTYPDTGRYILEAHAGSGALLAKQNDSRHEVTRIRGGLR